MELFSSKFIESQSVPAVVSPEGSGFGNRRQEVIKFGSLLEDSLDQIKSMVPALEAAVKQLTYEENLDPRSLALLDQFIGMQEGDTLVAKIRRIESLYTGFRQALANSMGQ